MLPFSAIFQNSLPVGTPRGERFAEILFLFLHDA